MLATDNTPSSMPPRTPRSDDAQRAVVAVAQGVVSHHAETAKRIERLITIDPGGAMGHAIRGMALSLQMRNDLRGTIGESLAHAEAALRERGGCEAERALTEALGAYARGEPRSALERMDAHVAAVPLDVMTLKLSHALHFLIGDTAGLRRTVDAAVAAMPDDFAWRGYAMGCQAFARIESGEPEEGERIGREAVARCPDDAWGVHAVAHALATRGRTREVVAWLRAHVPALVGVNNFGGHLAWHEALEHLALGDDDEALALYDTRIVVYLGGDYRDVVNAATLLSRLRRRGHDVRDRSAVLATHVASRIGDHGTAFGDVHHAMALADHDPALARRFASSMRRTARLHDTHEARVARQVACDLVDAIVALREGRPAAHLFEATRAAWPLLGGSRIQREAFQELFDEAVARRAELEGD